MTNPETLQQACIAISSTGPKREKRLLGTFIQQPHKVKHDTLTFEHKERAEQILNDAGRNSNNLVPDVKELVESVRNGGTTVTPEQRHLAEKIIKSEDAAITPEQMVLARKIRDANDSLTREEKELAHKIRSALHKKNNRTALWYCLHHDFQQHLNRRANGREFGHMDDEDYDDLVPDASYASISDIFNLLDSTETKIKFAFGCLASVLLGLVYPAFAYIFSRGFSALSNAPNDMSGVTRTTIWFVGLGVVAFIASYIQNTSFDAVAARASRKFALMWFKALLRQDAAYFDVNDIPTIANNITSSAKKIQIALGRKFGEGIQFATCALSAFIFAFMNSWLVSLIITLFLPLVAINAIGVMQFNQTRSAIFSKAYTNAGNVAFQTVYNIKTVLSLNILPEMIKRYKMATTGSIRKANTLLWKEGLTKGMLLGSFILLFLVLTIFGSLRIYTEVGQTGCDPSARTAGTSQCVNSGEKIFAAMLGVAFAGRGISQVAVSIEAFMNARFAAHPAMKSILRVESQSEIQALIMIRNSNGEANLYEATGRELEEMEDSELKTEGWKKYVLPKYQIFIDPSLRGTGYRNQIQGEIEFTNVSFAYPTRPDQLIYKKFNLTISAGTTIALVGPSGSGKSTLVNLIERFYDPTPIGKIELDGQDLKKYDVAFLRRNIGLVGQEPVLFANTIAENIRIGNPNATQMEIELAAKMAYAHEFIISLPSGYQTLVGENGAQLSGGQKQRVAIARVFLKNPKILILDEATSALDTQSEVIVQDAIYRLMKQTKRTTIIIAHRLTTIRNADSIVFIKDGKVAEQGTHQELMKSRLGLYKKLVELQDLEYTENSLSYDKLLEEGSKVTESSASHLIKFKDVVFSYPSRPEQKVLNNFNLNVRRGETMALVGPSGAGKSSVIALIERFYDADQGTIWYDNKKIKNMRGGWLRHQIGYVSQEPTLFDTTVANNIAYGFLKATKDDIIDAAKRANAHDFIMSFADGYDTEVGLHGKQLSAGQKQRIAIARAIVKKPTLLLLDEATSALDSNAEKVVQAALENLMASPEHTTIIVAHRLSTIRNADRIAYVANGIVKEIGSHQELMARKGNYYQLAESQQRIISCAETGIYREPLRVSEIYIGMKISKIENDTTTDKTSVSKWGKRVARKESNLLIFGAIGGMISGAVFPIWGILFAHMIKTLFFQIYPCGAESIELGVPPDHECDKQLLPGCFLSCEEYFAGAADTMETDSFFLAGFWVLIIVCAVIGNTFDMIGFGTAAERITKRLRDDAFTALVRQEVGYFDVRSTTKITSQLENDTSEIRSFAGLPMHSLVRGVSSATVGLLISFIYMWPFAAVSLILTPLVAFATITEVKLVLNIDNSDKNKSKKADEIAVETLLNMKTVASFNLESQVYDKFCRELDNDEVESRSGTISRISHSLSLIFQHLIPALQFWLGGFFLNRFSERYTFSDFLVSMFALLFSVFGLGPVAMTYKLRNETFKAATRLYELIHRKSKNDPLAQKETVVKGRARDLSSSGGSSV